jgi:hypothetical protein
VDYDGGIVGTAVKDAYARLQGQSFPTLVERSPAQFPTPDDLERKVCSTKYWAALYISPGATARLEEGTFFGAYHQFSIFTGTRQL